ncbi:MAG TPA: LysR family transcriptional regulator [Steroidobacteraceae bacterium]|jgi:DNA-binding transcriptional LysR family regulator
MTESLSGLRLFVRVARMGSISGAAREIGISQPAASRALIGLESELGVKLFTRNTRAVVLTDAGIDYLARVEPALDTLEEASHAARGTGELRGNLRIAVPAGIAVREIIPRLPDFVSRHPALRIHLMMEDRRQDLLRDNVDVALRFGPLTSSGATARLVSKIQRVAVASPSYLLRAGTPRSPTELDNHRIIFGPPGADSVAWTFERRGKAIIAEVAASLVTSVNDGAIAAAVASLGIVSTGIWGCRAELASGSLVRVLEGWSMIGNEIHAVFPAGRTAKVAARAFVEYLIGVLR